MKLFSHAYGGWVLLLGMLGVGAAQPAQAQLPSTAIVSPDQVPTSADTARVARPLTKRQKREKAAADSLLKTEHLLGMRVTRPQKAGYLAIIPGAGQLYNKKYWKLPLVYGMVGGLGYWVNFQRLLYLEYLHAYDNVSSNALVLRDPALGSRASRENSLTGIYSGLTGARHYLDLSLLVFAAGYSLQILDAVVDANLHDFDVGRTLSLHWTPALLPMPGRPLPAAGATVALRVK
ncbi:hypothetical protein FNT36_10170 [Hymenobacter setariae]|uniref:DUF5683 domain-containing protein n=1 Tax=Hymenobacter setariae TaxID=2594794 RepID=A0A558BZ42_9BACT|nr:DUF5683 domain-containing protein [Hymenobacter setariae]TVT41778.1 hypothetical protein FNT36_10170 [Hymenobacter setariae]